MADISRKNDSQLQDARALVIHMCAGDLTIAMRENESGRAVNPGRTEKFCAQ